jgi:F420-dependent methylenetetrahydromethanopterin dehydrogenase
MAVAGHEVMRIVAKLANEAREIRKISNPVHETLLR